MGEYDKEFDTFEQGNQADGLTVYNGYLEPDTFPIITNARHPNLSQTIIATQNRLLYDEGRKIESFLFIS